MCQEGRIRFHMLGKSATLGFIQEIFVQRPCKKGSSMALACCPAPSGSFWLTLALSDSLWRVALSGSLLLPEFASKALAWLTKPLLGSKRRS